jgi:hypothetical protein
MEHSILEPGFDGWPEKMERRTDRGFRIRHLGVFASDGITGTDRVTGVNTKLNSREARIYFTS